MPKVTLIAVFVAAILAFVVGWFAGRWALDREWSNAVVTISEGDVKRSQVEGADPTPAAGTRVMRALPLRKAREFIKGYTEKDPVIAKVGSFARDDDDKDLHLVVHNRGTCKANHFSGVAYGYDAWGHPSPVSKNGDYYIAFDIKDSTIDPGASGQLSMKVKDPGIASLAVAHLDAVGCENGPGWKRNLPRPARPGRPRRPPVTRTPAW
jgi:hypothetical protein